MNKQHRETTVPPDPTKCFVLRNLTIPSFYCLLTLQQIYFFFILCNSIHSQMFVHLTSPVGMVTACLNCGVYHSLQVLVKSVRIRFAFFQAVQGTKSLRRKGGPVPLPGSMLEILLLKSTTSLCSH